MRKELNITPEELLNAEKYIFTAEKITKNGITGWNFYILKNGEFKKVIGGNTWNDKKGYHHNTTLGIDRAFNLLVSIGYQLGIEHPENLQKKILIL